MAKIETLTDIPESDLKQTVEDFESAGATVEKTKQENGKWTVKATFPN